MGAYKVKLPVQCNADIARCQKRQRAFGFGHQTGVAADPLGRGPPCRPAKYPAQDEATAISIQYCRRADVVCRRYKAGSSRPHETGVWRAAGVNGFRPREGF